MIGLGYFWQELKKRIEQRLAERSAHLAAGKAQTFDQYREHIGYIAALNWVIGEASDIFGNQNKQPPSQPDED